MGSRGRLPLREWRKLGIGCIPSHPLSRELSQRESQESTSSVSRSADSFPCIGEALVEVGKNKKIGRSVGRFLGMAGIFEGAARAAAGAGGLAALLFGKFEHQHDGKNRRDDCKSDYCWGIHGFTSGRIRIECKMQNAQCTMKVSAQVTDDKSTSSVSRSADTFSCIGEGLVVVSRGDGFG